VDVLDLDVVDDKPLTVEVRGREREGLAREALAGERVAQKTGDADARGARAQKDDALLLDRDPRHAAAGEHARHRHGGRPLDVVVERGDGLLIAVEEAERVHLLEVLPLEEDLREAALDGLDELLDEGVVLGAPKAREPPAEIEGVVQERLVVRSDVEADRQRLRGVDARGGRVEGQLADRDPHAARALVTEAEDALVVGHDDEPHVRERRVAEDVVDPAPVGGRDPEPAGASEDVAELLAGPPDDRRVDDRQELLDVVHEKPVEQVLVAVLQGREADELLELVRLTRDVRVDAALLLLHRADGVGQEPLEAEGLPLLFAEGRALRVQGVPKQPCAPVGHLQPRRALGIVPKRELLHVPLPPSSKRGLRTHGGV
jgi:hypothetical protein